ncbi:cytochrome P450 3A8-like [Centruroides sculpturatus]|uniref:cytochrome P450 3A8-like n=1 Tax=Centruroides sculpturatus TaxID=218467 RepID=UPI000C6E46AD|nr:cytochrome P450 3A8-like [Centruroides sculpturatus]
MLWLLSSIILIFTIYLCLTRTYGYWEKRGIPYVKPILLFGSYGIQWNKPQGYVELEWCQKYGRIFGIFEGRKPILILAEPALIKDVFVRDFQVFSSPRDLKFGNPIIDRMLVSLDSEEWKRVRTIMTPTFSSGKIKTMCYLIKECALALKNNFSFEARKEKEIECGRLFGAFTIDVIARCAFGTRLDSFNDPDNPFVEAVRHLFSKRTWRVTFAFSVPRLAKLFRLSLFSPKVISFFKQLVLQLIEERKKEPKSIKKDFLQLLLDANEENVETSNNQERRKVLSLDEIVAQCILFILAGYHTTTNTLILTAYNLALNEDCQQRLIEEIDATTKNSEDSSFSYVNDMKYLEAAINESLRFCCPVPRIERRPVRDIKLSNTEIVIPKGMLVAVPVYAMHHNPEWYSNPEIYDPTRFLPENKSFIEPYTFLPFGAGPRKCLGRRFAMMEMKICLITLLTHFRFLKCPSTKIPLQFYGGLGLHRPKDVMIRIEERNS